MRVTITFGIETADILDAVSRAVTHAGTVTTVPIKSVHVEVT